MFNIFFILNNKNKIFVVFLMGFCAFPSAVASTAHQRWHLARLIKQLFYHIQPILPFHLVLPKMKNIKLTFYFKNLYWSIPCKKNYANNYPGRRLQTPYTAVYDRACSTSVDENRLLIKRINFLFIQICPRLISSHQDTNRYSHTDFFGHTMFFVWQRIK